MSDPHLLDPDHAPTPFTAEEIRIGCPTGRTVITRTVDDAGEQTQTTRFVAGSSVGATIEGARGTSDVSWRQLQAHASFPAADTEITREVIDIPVGLLECSVYRVERGDETHRFWFALDRPGMPVRITIESGGRILTETTMISDTVVPPESTGSS